MRSCGGFTLVELVIVIILLGILAFTALPRDPGRSIDLGSQADQLASDIRYTHSLSMTQGTRHCVYLDTAQARYQIRKSSCATPVAHPATGSSGYIVLSNVAMVAANISGDLIEFDGKGRPYTLSGTAEITLSSGGDSRKVLVSPETGRVVQQ